MRELGFLDCIKGPSASVSFGCRYTMLARSGNPSDVHICARNEGEHCAGHCLQTFISVSLSFFSTPERPHKPQLLQGAHSGSKKQT